MGHKKDFRCGKNTCMGQYFNKKKWYRSVVILLPCLMLVVFEKALKAKKFRDIWKNANVAPVHKKEENDLFKKLLSNWLLLTNQHIFVNSPWIRRRKSTWEAHKDFIDFGKRILVRIMTSFDGDLTFKIDKILTSSPDGIFFVVSTSNQRNCFTRCFHSIIS